MINLKQCKEIFLNHLDQYEDKSTIGFDLKLKHTFRVMKISKDLCKKINISREESKLAQVIALLHDIGRFEQVRQNNSFIDGEQSDHADYGVKILFDDNLIESFIDDRKYDNIIKKAIYNHNKYKIEEGLNEKELLHCKIIRDADKLDNFRVKEIEKLENIYPGTYNADTINYETISDKIYEDFMNYKCIKIEDRKTQIDYWISIIAFIFDLNFKESKAYIKEKNYIDILIDRIEYKNTETKEKMENIRKCAKEYLENSI